MKNEAGKGARKGANEKNEALEGDRKGAGASQQTVKREAAPDNKEDKLAKQRADWEGMTP